MRKHRISLYIILMILYMSFMTACVSPYETYTEEYYIYNETEDTVRLEMNSPIVWDVCPIQNPQETYYDSSCLPIAGGQIVRLHPVIREFRDSRSESKINVVDIIGTHTLLITTRDTLVWEVKYPYMFESDSLWSIYNKRDWQTVKDNQKSHTFYHTFIISSKNIERSAL